MNAEEIKERFETYTHHIPFSGCRIWIGGINRRGYGQFSVAGKTKKAHRISYRLYVADIPAGHDVDHRCNTPCCVEPSHLEAVTHAENMRRQGERRTHCRRGHEFTPENTIIKTGPAGRRQCRECVRQSRLRKRDRDRKAKENENE